jgi:heme exporter protein D
MDSWDYVLLAAAGYVAVVALVRLMLRQRKEVLDGLLAEAERERRQKAKKKREQPPRPEPAA